ncbi:MAG: hypothetical protein JXR88_09775 [Clostridia bacterium]|nr:hypothetical protein [Clostridia bacterium]
MLEWYFRNARALEIALFKYELDRNPKNEIVECLKAYQNEDGGFGHGLEPDCMNPMSSPIQTWSATQIILSLKLEKHPMIESILTYLEHTKDFKDNRYANTIESNNDYPHAPWWHFSEDCYKGWNPTVSLVGFILRYGDSKTQFYKKMTQIAKEAVDEVIKNGSQEMHELSCFLELRKALVITGLSKEVNFVAFEDQLKTSMAQLIEDDITKWSGYVCRPSTFIIAPEDFQSEFYSDLIKSEIQFLEETRNNKGLWDIPWSWGQYEEDFHVSKRQWEGIVGLKYMKFIKAFKGV